MNFLSAISRLATAGIALSVITACSGLNFGTANLLQSIDVFNDDISEMTFAIDAPLSLLPQDNGMIYKLDATTRELGSRHLAAVLVRGDDIASFVGLAPPANNRTYHLFSFSDADKVSLHEFQAWLRSVENSTDDAGGELTMEMDLKFCRVANADVSNVRVSVYVSLPNKTALNPLFSNVKLSELGGAKAAELPICVQT